jgi:hypothetical protein
LNVLGDQRLYQLVAAYDVQDEALLEFDKFTDSFQSNARGEEGMTPNREVEGRGAVPQLR